MNSLRVTTESMIEDSGSIGYIMELLEDHEDAKDNLKPEIDRVQSRRANA